MSGTLWLCGTPIGNLGDMTPRAAEVLAAADIIAAEDTRRTLALLNHFGVKKPLVSYHEHNRRERGAEILAMLQSGKNVALVTDAGMPAISDPGEELVRLCRENGVSVGVAPGPTAFAAALALSGLNSRRFAFEGFLPRQKRGRKAVLEDLKAEKRTIILYEAPHHLRQTLADLYSALGEREIALAREITKLHEETLTGALSYFLDYFAEREPKGEYVIVINAADKPAAPKAAGDHGIIAEIEAYTCEGYSRKDAMKLAAKARGVSKSEVYALYLKERQGADCGLDPQ